MLTEKLLNFYLMGAEWVLWLLILLSIFWVSIWIERTFFYFHTKENIPLLKKDLKEALEGKEKSIQTLTEKDTFGSKVLSAGLSLIQRNIKDPSRLEQAMLSEMLLQKNRYEKGLPILATIGNNAPFLGLFGTVLGIVQAFFQLGKMGAAEQASSNQMVMAAIGEALVATGVGILVAIPAVAAYNWSKTLVSTRSREAESLMRHFLSEISKGS